MDSCFSYGSSLAITDNDNTTDSQTCYYGHDDLGRLTFQNCGSLWTVNASYDWAGNEDVSTAAANAGLKPNVID